MERKPNIYIVLYWSCGTRIKNDKEFNGTQATVKLFPIHYSFCPHSAVLIITLLQTFIFACCATKLAKSITSIANFLLLINYHFFAHKQAKTYGIIPLSKSSICRYRIHGKLSLHKTNLERITRQKFLPFGISNWLLSIKLNLKLSYMLFLVP